MELQPQRVDGCWAVAGKAGLPHGCPSLHLCHSVRVLRSRGLGWHLTSRRLTVPASSPTSADLREVPCGVFCPLLY